MSMRKIEQLKGKSNERKKEMKGTEVEKGHPSPLVVPQHQATDMRETARERWKG